MNSHNRRPSKGSIYGLGFASFAAIVVSFGLFVTFLFGSTKYFLLAGLSDPSQPGNLAGRVFGTVIAGLAFLAYTRASWLYYQQVVLQIDPYDRACEAWGKISNTIGLSPDSDEAKKLLVDLGPAVIPSSTRLGQVVASWSDASPYSDAEAILDAEANPYRNFLNSLSSIASVLVLIGLVGNFFGLAEAAKNLPQLADVTSAKMTSSTTIQDQNQQVGNADKVTGKEQSSSTGSGAASGEQMSAKILKITSGLQVVVVSSVMGIGGMICMVIFVGYYRGIFNHLVAQEMLLMATEIGSAIRPLHSGQNSAMQELAKGVKDLTAVLQPIPVRLDKFDDVASKLAAAHLQMAGVVTQLDGALKHQLTQSNTSYGEYKEVLQDFKAYMVDRSESLPSLFEVSGNLGKRLTEMTDRVQKVQEHFETLVASQKQNQLKYDDYAQLVRTLANEDKAHHESKFREFSEATIREIQGSLHESAQELGKSTKESRQTLSELVHGIKTQVDSLATTTQGSQQSLVQDIKTQVEGLAKSLRTHLDNSLETQQSLVQQIKTVHQELQGAQISHLDKISQRFIQAQDQSTALLTSARQELDSTAQNFKVSAEDLQKKQATAADLLTQGFQQLMTSFAGSAEAAGNQLAAGSKAQQEALVGVFADQVRVALQDLGDFTQSSSASLQQQAKTSQEIQSELSSAVQKSLTVLEEARQRMSENADRWKTTQDLAVQSLFTRWNEEFSRLHPAEASSLPSISPSAESSQWAEVKEALQQLGQIMNQMQQTPALAPAAPVVRASAPVEPVVATQGPAAGLSDTDREALVSTFRQANQELRQVVETALGALNAKVQDQEQAWAERHAQQAQSLETLMGNLSQALAIRPGPETRATEPAAEDSSISQLSQALQEFKAYSEAALEAQREQSQSNRKWVSEVEKTLEAATQVLDLSKNRLLEGEDRWRSSQELSVQGLFTRWTEEFAEAGLHLPQFQQSLSRLDSCLERLTKLGLHEVLVCPQCGAVTHQSEGYCQGCQGSLISACPQQVFLAKSWDKAQAQMDERLAAIASAVQGLNHNIEQLELGSHQPSNLSNLPAPPVELDLAPLLQSLTGLRGEVQQMRVDNDRHQTRLLALAEAAPVEPLKPVKPAKPVAPLETAEPVAPVEPASPAASVAESAPPEKEPSLTFLDRIFGRRGKR